jgi:glycine/D-amino acid oxidase-like deaminating enzyme
VLIEAGGLCDGTTGNTTGKLTVQHGVAYTELIRKHGLDAAQDYARSQSGALDFVRDAVRTENIDCQLIDAPACLYAAVDDDAGAVVGEQQAMRRAGLDASLVENPWFPVPNHVMAVLDNQAAFHPVRYIEGLASAALIRGAAIYGGTKAVHIEDGEPVVVRCENGVELRARHLVMATEYPIYDGPNLFFTKLYPKRTYGIAVRCKKQLAGRPVHHRRETDPLVPHPYGGR